MPWWSRHRTVLRRFAYGSSLGLGVLLVTGDLTVEHDG